MPGAVAAEFTDLSRRLLDAVTVHDVLRLVVDTGMLVVDGAELVSVTLRTTDGNYETPVSTDALATSLDYLQYQLDEGPCVEATRIPGIGSVTSADLKGDGMFPRWGPAAADAGVHAVLAVGLFLGEPAAGSGALNFYAFQPGALDSADRDVALILAAHAATALAGTEARSAAELEKANLRAALQSRDVIGQAMGILMERRGIDSDEAFQVLRRASQSLNRKLVDIAAALAGRAQA